MQLTSSAFAQNGTLPKLYTCDGEGTHPPLAIEGVPAEASSLALIMEDPDVPLKIRPDGRWDHWLIWNLSPATKEIHPGMAPAGVYGSTTSQTTDYDPPCPPDREHRYIFRLFALDTVLDLPTGASKAELLAAMAGHQLAEAELISRYRRQ